MKNIANQYGSICKLIASDLKIAINIASSPSELCEMSDIIVTTTPSTSPILHSSDIKQGHHIVALGADSIGKIELESSILAKSDFVITDDHDQCLQHSEFGHAVRAELIKQDSDLSLGHLLDKNLESFKINNQTISIVDLTGIGAQDLAVSLMVYQQLS